MPRIHENQREFEVEIQYETDTQKGVEYFQIFAYTINQARTKALSRFLKRDNWYLKKISILFPKLVNPNNNNQN